MKALRTVFLGAALLILLGSTASAAVYTVVSNAPSGVGTLAWAIAQANLDDSPDEIRFSLGANKTISLTGALPNILHPVDINGTSQPGWAGQPLIEVNGTGAGPLDGFRVYQGPTTIRGLVINRFSANGISLNGGASNAVKSCYIGTNVSGTQDLGNGGIGVAVYVDTATIGGVDTVDRNVISGNTYQGIFIGDGAVLNTVANNYIGTNASGTAAIPNDGYGIRVLGQSNWVGVPGDGNLISGNGRGVSLEGGNNYAFGNTIGLNAAGTAKLPNNGDAISLHGPGQLVGGTAPGERNVLSGNTYQGVGIASQATNCDVIGNYIGTNATGTAALGNDGYGIRTLGSDNTIADNLISGNGRGVSFEYGASGNVMTGNKIGTSASGANLLPNGGYGVEVSSGPNIVGVPGDGNLIAGNAYDGIGIDEPVSGIVIQSNEIRHNTYSGIRILGGAHGNTIGGTGPGEGNSIHHNGYYGVFVENSSGNALLGNAIFANDLWGIDLEPYGPQANDPLDQDFGPNHRQNFPVILDATTNGVELTANGKLESTPGTVFRIEVFGNSICDPSGMGEGELFLGAFDVTTNANGVATFSESLPVAGAHPFVTATATDQASNDTSEISPCIATTGPNPGTIQYSQELFLGYESEPDGLATIAVVRSGGLAGTVSVNYATGPSAAQPGIDYQPTSGTLTFGPGEFLKTFDVPVLYNPAAEGQEDVPLVLSNPTGGAVLGAQASSKIVIIDYDTNWPAVYVSDGSVVEGDNGNASMVFTITLTAATQPVTVSWETYDGTATAGVDYQESSGQLVFNPGDPPKQVVVPVFGDDLDEGVEAFHVWTYNVQTGVVADAVGDGVIIDDDQPSAPAPASQPCMNGTTVARPKVTLFGLGDAPGNERLVVQGALVFVAGTPAGTTPLDMIARGAQLLVEDLGSGGSALLELTADVASVPPGTVGNPAACSLEDGWSQNQAQTRYRYQNLSNALPDAACTSGSASGLRALRIADRRAKAGQIGFRATAREASIATPVGPLRATIVLGADAAAGDAGFCGTHAFSGADCETSSDGKVLRCS